MEDDASDDTSEELSLISNNPAAVPASSVPAVPSPTSVPAGLPASGITPIPSSGGK